MCGGLDGSDETNDITMDTGNISDSLSDIDDVEVDRYLLNEEEKCYKKKIWEQINREFLEEQSAKEAAATAKKEAFAANFKGSSEELAACELAGATNAAVANAKMKKQQKRASEARSLTSAQTAAGTTNQMLEKRVLFLYLKNILTLEIRKLAVAWVLVCVSLIWVVNGAELRAGLCFPWSLVVIDEHKEKLRDSHGEITQFNERHNCRAKDLVQWDTSSCVWYKFVSCHSDMSEWFLIQLSFLQRLSSKVNYEALEKLFAQTEAPENTKKQKTELHHNDEDMPHRGGRELESVRKHSRDEEPKPEGGLDQMEGETVGEEYEHDQYYEDADEAVYDYDHDGYGYDGF